MFTTLQTEILARSLSCQTFTTTVCRIGNGKDKATAKGLVFVALYGLYEYTVRASVRTSLTMIKLHGRPINTIIPELLGLALDAEIASVIDSARTRHWGSRVELFQKSCGSSLVDVADTAFPHDGSHYRIAQLRTIWTVFDIRKPVVPNGRLIPLIDELVENRNSIAHGRDTAEDVGHRYTDTEMLQKANGTQAICLHIVDTMKNHCSDPSRIYR